MNIYRKNNTIIVLSVAIFLLVVSGLIYNFYFKDYGEYNKKDNIKESLYIDITDESILNDILNTIKNNNLKDVAAFERNIDNINVLEPIEKINIAYNSIKKDDTNEIDVLEIDNYFENAFKTTIYWDKSDIYCTNGEVVYIYDISNNKYIYNAEHNCEKHNYVSPIYTKFIKAKKKNDMYVVTVSFIWNNSEYLDTMYSNYNDALNQNNPLFVIPSEDGNITEETINNFINSNYDNVKDKLHTYTYVFEKIDDKYLLDSFKYQ